MSDGEYRIRVTVTLKSGVLDPQGKAIEGAAHSLGMDTVKAVRQGKVFDLSVQASDSEAAQSQVTELCEKLLANTVIENYAIEVRS